MIVTWKEQETALPAPSVAVYVTVVVPIGKASPALCVEDRVTEPELSEAVGLDQLTVPVASPLSVLADWLPGQPVMLGISSSVKISKSASIVLHD